MKHLINKKNTPNIIKKATQILKEGNLVIFPTETVYGIGANATLKEAILKIYKIKKRPLNNPLICHFSSIETIRDNFKMKKVAYKLAEFFWPGPLTLILEKKKSSKINSHLSNNNKFVGCRIPNHPIALELLKSVSFPIAAPSANIATKLSSTRTDNLDKKLKNKVFYIDGGASKLGLESTVVDLTTKNPKILRYGSITKEQLRKIIPNIAYTKSKKSTHKSPGMSSKHYSPNTPIRINVKKVLNHEVLLNFGNNHLISNIFQLNLSLEGNLEEAAKNLYNYLHILDNPKYKSIAVAPIPNRKLGKTINDRLKRASAKK